MTDLRSTQQQFNDEFHETYRRMTDPDEIEKNRIKRERERHLQSLEEDAGL